MAQIIQMPKLSDTMEEGAVASWHKKVGDKVKEGDLLLEIETDKATMEYESPESGVLLKIVVEAGQKCALNAPIAVLGDKDEDPEEALKGSSTPKDIPPPPEKPLQEAKADKPAAQSSVATKQNPSSAASSSSRIKVSPLAKKIAAEKGIDLLAIQGSGPAGRIVQKDVENTSTSNAVQRSTAMITNGEDQIIPVNMMRATIAKRLLAAKNEAPHFYLTRSVDMTRMNDWRKDLNKQLKDTGEKISVNDLVVMAVAKALRQHPQVNSSWEGDQIRQFANVHVAVAVAMPAGLVTPVIPHTDQLGVRDISKKTKELVAQVKSGGQVDYASGTFTISNLGMFGIEEFTAIINPPQAAILAVGTSKDTPVVDNGEIKIKSIMKITMSCDHRVIDGAVGAKFLKTLCGFLENPLMILS